MPAANKNIPKHPLPSSQNNQVDPTVPSSCFPWHYCGEVGHWSPNCPVKAKVNEAWTKARRQKANVAGIGVVPTLEASEALLDSGATHSVVGHLSLFTSLMSTNMTLSVASSKSFKVDAIGTIELSTSSGILRLHNVLYCCNIPGVILSLGHLLKECFLVSFSNDLFKISTSSLQVTTIKKHNRWFIPFHFPIGSNVSVNCLSSKLSSPKSAIKSSNDISFLWHRRIGHLSVRQLTRMLKLNAVIGSPNLPFCNIKLCHDC
ncbi:hypothetical protein O181_102850 [Austropuccinia psidii MF-1]|uniref:CCHC-type domain-containing protein n=1 Tax=Austropuccinia psidii MF-1 TaxID=1389203 RepID=A0A9Q3PJ61_9BASI|nr:hypothetical protein [Austropuccinia psidii MF-1]